MSAASAVHNFQDSLAFSHSCDELSIWSEIYRKAFPSMVTMVNHRANGDHQKAGIDRSIILENSKQLLVDEKARRFTYRNDILLEYLSNDRTGALGWVEKPLLCDYIAYAFIYDGLAFLLPVPQMQTAWNINKTEWLRKYDYKSAPNAGYKTLSCPVPTDVLFKAIGAALRITFCPEIQF